MFDLLQCLRKLTALPTPSGREEAALPWLQSYFSPLGAAVEADRFGNVLAVFGTGKTLLDAHIDKIGLVVTGMDPQGFLHAAPVGRADTRVLAAADMTVYTAKKEFFAVAASVPPHLRGQTVYDAPPAEDLLFDIGFCGESLPPDIEPGDRLLFRPSFHTLSDGVVTSPYLDNSAGAAVLLLTAFLLSERGALSDLAFCFSAQEEAGLRGASPAVFQLRPEKAFVVDVSFARQPGAREEHTAEQGSGPMIGFSPALDHDLSRALRSLAEEKNLPHTAEIMGGATGTNADVISKAAGGRKTALLSIPIRNMHTPVETVRLSDIENTARLLADAIERGL